MGHDRNSQSPCIRKHNPTLTPEDRRITYVSNYHFQHFHSFSPALGTEEIYRQFDMNTPVESQAPAAIRHQQAVCYIDE
jgi:hypothetical protein